jgi:hypothetical protein
MVEPPGQESIQLGVFLAALAFVGDKLLSAFGAFVLHTKHFGLRSIASPVRSSDVLVMVSSEEILLADRDGRIGQSSPETWRAISRRSI